MPITTQGVQVITITKKYSCNLCKSITAKINLRNNKNMSYNLHQRRYEADNFKYNFICDYTYDDNVPLTLSNITIDDICLGDKYFVIKEDTFFIYKPIDMLVYSHGNKWKYENANQWRLGHQKELIDIYFGKYMESNNSFGLYLYDQLKDNKKFINWYKKASSKKDD